MTELTITPKVADKTARFKGTVAAGEHVAVTIKGGAEWLGEDDGANLTLRVLDLVTGRTLAVFPRPAETLEDGETQDAWSVSSEDANDLYCELNLNTTRMVAAARHMLRVPVLFVLGDTDNPRTLYFRDRYEIEYWPERIGDTVPYDLDRWPKQIDEWVELVAEFETRINTAKTEIEQAKENVTDAISSIPGTVATAVEESNSNKADKVANATNGNFAGLDQYGNLTDSGKNASDFATATQAEEILDAFYRETTALNNAVLIEQGTRSQENSALNVRVGVLEGEDMGKSVRSIAAEEIAEVVAGADTDFDTLKEVADWIKNDSTGAAKMQSDIADLNARNEYTTAEKQKLAGIDTGANNYVLPSATASTLGGVKQGSGCTIESDGTLNVTGASQDGTLDSAAVYPAWESGVAYPKGTVVSYNGRLYRKKIEGSGGPITVKDPTYSETWWEGVTIAELKQDALSVQQLANIDAVPNKADSDDLPYAMYTPQMDTYTPWAVEWTPTEENPSTNAIIEWIGNQWQINGSYDGMQIGGDATSVLLEGEAPQIGIATYSATRSLAYGLHDRANNLIDASTGNKVLILPPLNNGKVRDLLVACTIGLDSNYEPWSVIFQGADGEEISFKAEGDDAASATFPVPDAAGDWWYSLTERAPHVFAVSLKQLQSVTQEGS